jgi:hypothetical protein
VAEPPVSPIMRIKVCTPKVINGVKCQGSDQRVEKSAIHIKHTRGELQSRVGEGDEQSTNNYVSNFSELRGVTFEMIMAIALRFLVAVTAAFVHVAER